MHTPGPRPAQSVSAVQGTQVFEPEQTGWAFGQSVFVRHCTQAPPLVEQKGVAGVSVMQVVSAAGEPQPTQVPAAEQNGADDDDEQSPS